MLTRPGLSEAFIEKRNSDDVFVIFICLVGPNQYCNHIEEVRERGDLGCNHIRDLAAHGLRGDLPATEVGRASMPVTAKGG